MQQLTRLHLQLLKFWLSAVEVLVPELLQSLALLVLVVLVQEVQKTLRLLLPLALHLPLLLAAAAQLVLLLAPLVVHQHLMV
jgi:hypothetical protein